jgi:hypothetical protein
LPLPARLTGGRSPFRGPADARTETAGAPLDRGQSALYALHDRGAETFEGFPGEGQIAGTILYEHSKNLSRL